MRAAASRHPVSAKRQLPSGAVARGLKLSAVAIVHLPHRRARICYAKRRLHSAARRGTRDKRPAGGKEVRWCGGAVVVARVGRWAAHCALVPRGCTDSTADNYASDATVALAAACVTLPEPRLGCTLEAAYNFDSSATALEPGACVLPVGQHVDSAFLRAVVRAKAASSVCSQDSRGATELWWEAQRRSSCGLPHTPRWPAAWTPPRSPSPPMPPSTSLHLL